MEFTLNTNKGIFTLLEIQQGINFYVNMGYLIYKVPNYETWIKDEDLLSPNKINKHLEKIKDKDEWIKTVIKLPNQNLKFICVTKSYVVDTHVASQNLNEETAKEIVGEHSNITSIEYLQNMLTSMKMPKDKFYAILK